MLLIAMHRAKKIYLGSFLKDFHSDFSYKYNAQLFSEKTQCRGEVSFMKQVQILTIQFKYEEKQDL